MLRAGTAAVCNELPSLLEKQAALPLTQSPLLQVYPPDAKRGKINTDV